MLCREDCRGLCPICGKDLNEGPCSCKTDEKNRYLIDVALSLEGVTKSYGKHAGGIVISPTLITDFAPLICEKDGSQPVTQFDKHDVEEVGLVKFDFLGIRDKLGVGGVTNLYAIAEIIATEPDVVSL